MGVSLETGPIGTLATLVLIGTLVRPLCGLCFDGNVVLLCYRWGRQRWGKVLLYIVFPFVASARAFEIPHRSKLRVLAQKKVSRLG